jgi:DNA-binding NarL/FixJ family response regulator
VTRLLIVASSPVVRAGLEAVLGNGHGLAVVAAVDSAIGLAAAVEAAAPDVVVFVASDAQTPPSLSVVPDREAQSPALVVLAPRRDPVWASRALALGALAVLTHDARPEEILAAIEAASAGLLVLSPDLAPAFEDPAPRDPPPRSDERAILTPRELEVLQWLAEGLANKQVAARLGLSEHTIKTHVTSVFEKLGVGTRAEAVARAVRLGLLIL